MANWNYEVTEDDIVRFVRDYVASLDDSQVTDELIWEQIKHHAPYFWLERSVFLIVSPALLDFID